MIKRIIPLLLFGILLSGCTVKESPPAVQPNTDTDVSNQVDEPERDTLYMLHVQPGHFQYVVDWLSDTEIIYVEQEEDTYAIKRFDRLTGKSHLIDREDSFINDVLVHPSKQSILIHMSDDSDAATVKVIALDGTVLHKLTIESKEISIEWNDIDENLLLLTAFHEDWSFDLFYYDGYEQEMTSIHLEDPFPKWLGTDQLLTLHQDEDGTLYAYDLRTNKMIDTGISDVVQFDTYFDSLLTMMPSDDQSVTVDVRDRDGEMLGKVEMPSISSFSGLVMPDFDWVSKNELVLKFPTVSGKLVEMTEPFHLVRVKEGEVKKLMEDVPEGPLHCSPSGHACLIGYEGENVIDLGKRELQKWLDQ
ncbi:hypothetical protein [Sporosarcina sp. Te-1]|uniref:YqgU-like beta propeller domain-containing protein n=1 Tax=Sporosarcina sp. Te-1 TaxID=2818390 RepID=UPI001A9F3637|nr:hypothetical protein [Sporosarcina sp. Te-1]QTD41695.1 hypothetical protein J3U78_02235 [Sporosarcina sp. Te-1]